MAGSSGRQKAASRPTKASKRVPVEKFIRGEHTPLEHLLALMNDSSLPPMRSQAIARRLAPYLHAKLKPISAGEGPVTPLRRRQPLTKKPPKMKRLKIAACSANRSDKKSLAVAIKVLKRLPCARSDMLLHVHQLEQAEPFLFVVKEPVNVGIVVGLTTRGRAEHVEMFNAKPLQVGFVLLQSAFGFVAFHKANIATRSLRFRDFLLMS